MLHLEGETKVDWVCLSSKTRSSFLSVNCVCDSRVLGLLNLPASVVDLVKWLVSVLVCDEEAFAWLDSIRDPLPPVVVCGVSRKQSVLKLLAVVHIVGVKLDNARRPVRLEELVDQ